LRSSIDSDRYSIKSDALIDYEQNNDDFYNEKHKDEFQNIKSQILDNKLYLNPLLSQDDLAAEMGISRSHFSKLVNSYSGHNFSDFINYLRVEQAKKFLSNHDFRNYTMVSIGLECGFNSKSTFYTAFKKFTSETPTSFRAQF
jgi:AraC-like DNA-binding protein